MLTKSMIGLVLVVFGLFMISAMLFMGKTGANFLPNAAAAIGLYIIAFYHFRLNEKPATH